MKELINDLLKEKSLWDIWWKSCFSGVKTRQCAVNALLLALTILTSSVFVYFWDATITVLVDALKSLIAGGVSYAITMQGFLLAGFSVITTMMKPDLVLVFLPFKKSLNALISCESLEILTLSRSNVTFKKADPILFGG